MNLSLDDLPQSLRDIVELIGLPAALKLVEHYGGLVVFVPLRGHDEHELNEALGRKAAAKMLAHYQGETIYVPKCDEAVRAVRDGEIVRRYAADATVKALAREYKMSERQIRNILRRPDMPADDRQGGLFG